MYHHKSGSQKRKQKREREQEDERMKNKKPLLQFFKKSSDRDAGEDCVDAGKVSSGIVEQDNFCNTGAIDSTSSNSVSCNKTSSPTTCAEVEESASCRISNVTEVTLIEEGMSCSLSSIGASESFESLGSLEGVNWKDPAFWPDTLRSKARECIVLAGLMSEEELLKMVQYLPKDCDGQAFSEFHLYSKSSNGCEKILRDWLRWSDGKKALYCTPCLAFSSDSSSKTGSVLCKKEGFDPTKSKWHKLYKKLPEHEHSAQHRKNYWSWRCLQKSMGGHGVDNDMQRTLAREAEKFTVLLERLLDVTLFLASRNLAFRGSSQRIGDIHNGNFLGILELVSHYDAELREHLDKVKRSQEKGKKLPAHYLSWGTQNEFINLCGQHVLNAILSERQEAIYFSLICDASPDISHTEQNVIVLRYVHRDSRSGNWCIQERFLEFFDFFQKTGDEIAGMITSRMRDHNIDLKDCRGQGYDNGANMSGRIKGVKSRIQERYPEAMFCPCAAHSLNLVGVHAASSCPEVKTFFGSVNRLYILFSNSPERWHTLTEEIAGSLHGLSDTRWSSRVEAVRPVAKKLPSILRALER
ncbi:hypothetical protein XENTR_v10001616 [Xenopus tropicalis]|uniref:Zinc finger MYM-type protein 1 n=1 Tax=Xenopus tropicalis TaxID=8364 RepID=A0A803JK13_XENTR|nr:zinc finger MYM-type protein 1 [Xenopus tropicalis]KAE8632662.1 hypothetical protein XENTR_v10001616 [Xenopus tropicalis]|eukprot:XP_017953209.1 PREDICTED: zinc finger MYM-type protein 1-like [Xenopus tropicalis]